MSKLKLSVLFSLIIVIGSAQAVDLNSLAKSLHGRLTDALKNMESASSLYDLGEQERFDCSKLLSEIAEHKNVSAYLQLDLDKRNFSAGKAAIRSTYSGSKAANLIHRLKTYTVYVVESLEGGGKKVASFTIYLSIQKAEDKIIGMFSAVSENITVFDQIAKSSLKETVIGKYAGEKQQVKMSKKTRAVFHNCEVCGKYTKQTCSKCKRVYYCGSDCQKSHWSEHKKTCTVRENS